jgi:acyl-CoA synthetase (AMP-forming)/AMP-acid ligase II
MPKLSTLAPGDWVTAGARQRPGEPCLVTPAGVRTYAQVNHRANQLARGLAEVGLRKGDRITVLSTDSAEYVELVLASMKLGTTVVPLNFRLSAQEISNVIRAAEPALHVAAERYADSVPAARMAVSGLKATAMLAEDRAAADTTVTEIAAAGDGDAQVISSTTEEDILFVMLTSGTTGTPKMVMQPQRMVRAVAFSGVYEQRLKAGDFMYSGAPLFHVAGLGHIMYALACRGASLILPQWDPAAALHWLREGGLNHCMMVPSMVLALLDQPGATEARYPALRSIMFGGAPMPPVVIKRLAEVFAGCDLYNAFGSTQVGGQTVFNADDHKVALGGQDHLLGSIGRPVMGTDIRIRGEGGEDVKAGDIGEIWSRSESVFSGYLNQPELTAQTVVDGWYRTGDLGRMDERGYVFLSGRGDDMIIRGGENVYPVEIESVIAELPAVAEVAVIGLPDAFWGQTVAVVATIRDDAALTLDELRAHCRGRLASYKVPERLVIIGGMPRSSSGKIQKFRLLELVESAADGGGPAAAQSC